MQEAMSAPFDNVNAMPRVLPAALMAIALAPMIAACGQEVATVVPQARPVRVVTVEKRTAGTPVTLTGRIEAEDEVTFAFRISGRVLENPRKLGDAVLPGQVVARLKSQNELNGLRSAKAGLAAAQGQLIRPAIISNVRTLFLVRDGPHGRTTIRPSRRSRPHRRRLKPVKRN